MMLMAESGCSLPWPMKLSRLWSSNAESCYQHYGSTCYTLKHTSSHDCTAFNRRCSCSCWLHIESCSSITYTSQHAHPAGLLCASGLNHQWTMFVSSKWLSKYFGWLNRPGLCLQGKVTLMHSFSRSQQAGSTSTSSFSFSDSTLRQSQKEANMVVLDDDGLTVV